ncbi:MAG: archaetidylserine decarboxylase [Waddliaceae bacterium]
MKSIAIIDRESGGIIEEKFQAASALNLLYGNSRFSKIFRKPFHLLITRFPPFSFLYGLWQRLPFTKKKIFPFIEKFQIDRSEFLLPINEYRSFNDFFIRKLLPAARPIAQENKAAVMPADARYSFYENIAQTKDFLIKGEKLNLKLLLQDEALASKYSQGPLIIARLAPSDYHRYHFPVDCIPGESRLINGYLYSVNPLAIKHNVHILAQNKRSLCNLRSECFGDVLFIEVGATCVGTINQTYIPDRYYQKGSEKGYFSFGASTILLFFEPNRLIIDKDLVEAFSQGLEVKCKMGQRLGLSASGL